MNQTGGAEQAASQAAESGMGVSEGVTNESAPKNQTTAQEGCNAGKVQAV